MAVGGDYVVTETHNIIQNFSNINLTSVDTGISKLISFQNAVTNTEELFNGLSDTITSTFDGLSASLNGIINGLARVQGSFRGIPPEAKAAGDFIANQFGLSADAVIDFSKSSIAAYQNIRSADAQNMVALKNNGGAAGKTLNELRASAKEFSKTTLFDAESTAGAQASVLAFKNIKGAIIDQAIPAIQDMAQSQGDLKGSTDIVAAALHDPVQGMEDLSNAGVEFSASQQDMVRTMMKHNDTAGAQGIILDGLQQRFGGAAVAAREAAGGQGDFDMSVKNLQVSFGGLLTEGLNPILTASSALIDTLTTAVDWLSSNSEIVEYIGETLGVAALALGLFQGILITTKAATDLMTAGQWLLNGALSANPIGAVVGGVVLLIGGLMIAYKHVTIFRAAVDGVIAVGQLLGEVFTGVGKIIKGALSGNMDMLLKGVKETAMTVGKIANGGIGDAFNKGVKNSLAKTAQAEKDKKAEEERKKKEANTVPKALPDSPLNKNKLTGGNSLIIPSGGIKNQTPNAGSTQVPGNNQVRNVQVTIGKLVENLTISTTNLQGTGSGDLRRIITEILTGAVYDSELALGD